RPGTPARETAERNQRGFTSISTLRVTFNSPPSFPITHPHSLSIEPGMYDVRPICFVGDAARRISRKRLKELDQFGHAERRVHVHARKRTPRKMMPAITAN